VDNEDTIIESTRTSNKTGAAIGRFTAATTRSMKPTRIGVGGMLGCGPGNDSTSVTTVPMSLRKHCADVTDMCPLSLHENLLG
jgi:hypothetical protein